MVLPPGDLLPGRISPGAEYINYLSTPSRLNGSGALEVQDDDYDKLPARKVPRSAQPFRFPDSTAGDWVAPLKLVYAGQPIGDEAALSRFLEEHGSTAFIAIKEGRLLDERYYNGFRRDSLFKSFSVTKSVIDTLVGIAIEKGYLKDKDESEAE